MAAPIFYLAPLQGFTEYPFRKAMLAAGTIPSFFVAPFVDAHEYARGKARRLKDILPENNEGISLIPQLLGSNPDELAVLMAWYRELGYSNVSFNLGCPYPMVALKGSGSGLIGKPEVVRAILDKLFTTFPDIQLSVKTRLGYLDSSEIETLIPVLNQFPLAEVVVHPRIGKQLYKGDADLDAFAKVLPTIKAPVCYNGDILSVTDYQERSKRFPTVTRWMIGRAALQNPLIFNDIAGGIESDLDEKLSAMHKLHDALFQHYVASLSGNSHLIKKMAPFWEYFSLPFPERRKAYKKVVKATTADHYRNATNEFFAKQISV
ncbi:tRNA dihydrouridine synthase [Williamwhitmania taraxaci]|nr:tRNA-dihydrouridine synthase family protein [Williamwhitmania taraxaci]